MEQLRSHGWITTREASKALGCTVQHLRLLIRDGQIMGQKHGRDWFCDERSVQDLISKRETSQSEPPRVRERLTYSLFPELLAVEPVNVASVPQRSPLRYPGGKTWLIPTVRAWLDSLSFTPTLFHEPFAGGGGMSLMAAAEARASAVRMVELDPVVARLWRAATDGSGLALAKAVREFEFCDENVKLELSRTNGTPLQLAFQTLLRNRVSRGGILAPGAGLVKTGEGGRGIASRWYPETLARRLEAIHSMLDRISFHEGDGLESLKELSQCSKAVHFVDPPYPVAGKRLYTHSQLDHRGLFDILRSLQGPFLATYDDNEMIAELAEERGFDIWRVPMKSTHHERKLELLISRDLSWLKPQKVSVAS